MSTLAEIRERVRTQLDLPDEDDLATSSLDGFIREGFDRTFFVEKRWPFFEYTWSLPLAADATSVDLPSDPDVAVIISVRDTTTNYRLQMVDHSHAEDYWFGTLTAAEPTHFSLWAGELTVWPPNNSDARTYSVRGYRKPTWTGTPGDELDGDSRLHLPMLHYACSLAYAQLEDPELEDVYMRRWAAGVAAARDEIMRPQHHEPLILNGGIGLDVRRSRLYLDV